MHIRQRGFMKGIHRIFTGPNPSQQEIKLNLRMCGWAVGDRRDGREISLFTLNPGTFSVAIHY